MIEELHRENFHIVLHLTKPPEHLHGRVSDTGAAGQEMSDAAFYWARHLDVFRLGVDGWWPDEGDPLAPEARVARNRLYWEGPIKERPNERPFALHRNGYEGLQRYGWLWSGDVDCTWETLEAQIPVGLNTGLSGLPLLGHRHRRFCADQAADGGTLCAVVSIQHVLPAVPVAWPDVEASVALGMEHWRIRPFRDRPKQPSGSRGTA